MEKKMGNSPTQLFEKAHVEFVKLLNQGMHPVEIGMKLGLTKQQITRHNNQVFLDEQILSTQCAYKEWKELSREERLLLPCKDKNAIIKILKQGEDKLILGPLRGVWVKEGV